MSLVPVTAATHQVEIDLRYATANNFTGQPVYARADCYLHADAAAMLAEAVRLAANIGLRLRIFDAFRPTEAQWVLWHHTPDPDFLAHPEQGSPHSRGAAVDLTLVDGTGTALDMGTDFDAFTSRSRHGNTEISESAIRNRLLLMGIMTSAGWDFYSNEWWHYQLFNAPADYPRLYADADLPRPMMPPA
ncbi:MAG: D-alanyl-D-alanine dipeptidase [Alphaproteobacteria bacterium]|nr:D-alanyl-D-alanine dipeptidase [Alphaproteobacteria bacterium]